MNADPLRIGFHTECGRLTHWGRVTHICVNDLTSIGSDNGLSPGRRQAIIRTNAGILLIRPLGTNFSEFLVEILIVSFKKMRLKVSFAKRLPFCLGLNELRSVDTSRDIVPRLTLKMGYKEINRVVYTRCDVTGCRNDALSKIAPAPILSHPLAISPQILQPNY